MLNLLHHPKMGSAALWICRVRFPMSYTINSSGLVGVNSPDLLAAQAVHFFVPLFFKSFPPRFSAWDTHKLLSQPHTEGEACAALCLPRLVPDRPLRLPGGAVSAKWCDCKFGSVIWPASLSRVGVNGKPHNICRYFSIARSALRFPHAPIFRPPYRYSVSPIVFALLLSATTQLYTCSQQQQQHMSRASYVYVAHSFVTSVVPRGEHVPGNVPPLG